MLGRSAVAAGTQAIQSSASMAATMSWMDMGDISITEKRRRELNEKFGTSEQRQEALMVIRRGRITAAHVALSSATWAQNKTVYPLLVPLLDRSRPLHLHRASKAHHETDISSSARTPWRACFQYISCC